MWDESLYMADRWRSVLHAVMTVLLPGFDGQSVFCEPRGLLSGVGRGTLRKPASCDSRFGGRGAGVAEARDCGNKAAFSYRQAGLRPEALTGGTYPARCEGSSRRPGTGVQKSAIAGEKPSLHTCRTACIPRAARTALGSWGGASNSPRLREQSRISYRQDGLRRGLLQASRIPRAARACL